MAVSVQQIKFEFLSYIKEFGGGGKYWQIGVADDAAQEMFENQGVDRASDVWLWKPAVSPKAAELVVQWFVGRQMASAKEASRSGSNVFLYRIVRTDIINTQA